MLPFLYVAEYFEPSFALCTSYLLLKPILYVPAGVEAGTLTVSWNTASFEGTIGSPLASVEVKLAPRIFMFVITALFLKAGVTFSIAEMVRGESILNLTSIPEIA